MSDVRWHIIEKFPLIRRDMKVGNTLDFCVVQAACPWKFKVTEVVFFAKNAKIIIRAVIFLIPYYKLHQPYLTFRAHTNCCWVCDPPSPIPKHNRIYSKKSRHKKWDEAAIFLFVPAVKLNLVLRERDRICYIYGWHTTLKETSKWQSTRRGHPVWEIIICRRIIHAINVKWANVRLLLSLSASFLVRLFYRTKRCARLLLLLLPGYIKFISGEQTQPGDYARAAGREKIEAHRKLPVLQIKARCREKQVPSWKDKFSLRPHPRESKERFPSFLLLLRSFPLVFN